MPVHKPFNQSNYDANDASGKEVVTQFLTNKGLDVQENSNKYGIDLIANGTTYNGKSFVDIPIEVERRNIWTDTFPFPTVHVPERKTKFLSKYMLYAVVNSTYDRVMFCSSDIIKQFIPIEVPNKSIQAGEYFYDVPLKHWKVYYI